MSSDEIAISVRGLGKSYRIQHKQKHSTATEALFNRLRNPFRSSSSSELVWALKDVSFDVARGEVIGVVGRNGAGKSTLLKILSRITEPTTGEARIAGRVGSLIEVGTGFQPELTGRENIYLNGSILGMRRREITRRFDEIVDFSGVEKFLDTPVKRYSSGMYVRLAFAVAAHLDTEILLVDEVLSVGDAEFQKKSLGKMGDVASAGRTVLFVSHNMGAVKTFTTKSILLEHGGVTAIDDSATIVSTYLMKGLEAKAEARASRDLDSFRRWERPDPPAKVLEIKAFTADAQSDLLPEIDLGSGFTIEIRLAVFQALQAADLCVVIMSAEGEAVTSLVCSDYLGSLSLRPGEAVVNLKVNDLRLAPGRYFVDVWLDRIIDGESCDSVHDYPLLVVANKGQVSHVLNRVWGSVYCPGVECTVTEQVSVTARVASL
ncbi:MAG: polysaccharide ABC transporter ATP-binding protein [Alphaproteobacteria bacterium]